MNRTTKGALAAGAAGVLLLGGAGSFALWSDSEGVQGGTITAGDLDIAPVSQGVWTDVSPGSVSTAGPVDPATFRMVPGDVLEYRASYRVTADGENLRAVLTADPNSVTRTGELTEANTPVTVTSTYNGTPLAGNQITEADNGRVVDVVARVTFVTTTPNQVGTNDSVNLSGFRINLQQSART
ncbi:MULTISPECIES: alternate-type signal peptide domain-containing protein [Nocardiaceae]|uniref:Alternate-type signal peptide domain-containing protein n=1 Tax=Rhodococcoides kroppenstedtii TaxID=293050 RepID=A0ABS7NSA1_9NOCA|nr:MULTISPECIES: alternate-type signal peptide domain-containing protein [Rhodococcus]AMY17929.1 hypothetical protein A3Q40_00520 [Rhodococcus sp. PBTS 1]MBY6313196.1 alternate-type signal peptide domain-containing protein [Rhodococcus kroppenstedtii]MBY6320883.1 alternate-type signal peptide domain-containing protein [Rhodococcus kroppenstedtii]MBY6399786.1 alternate-type signal peptide domain-containing protein [Rhodococcus kroppenstedtii]